MVLRLDGGAACAGLRSRSIRTLAAQIVSSLAALTLIVLTTFCLSGCGGRGDESNRLSPRVVEYGQPVPKGGGVYKTGSAYRIKGRVYQPSEQPNYDRTGIASWYGDLFHGRYTANGEIYDMDRLSAAHPTLPLPVLARVTNLANGRSLVVRVNDRGPYAHNRIIDLSRQSARVLGFERKGTAPVRVEYLGRAPMNGDDSYERRYLAGQPWAQRSYAGIDLPKVDRNAKLALAAAAPVIKAKAQQQDVTGSVSRAVQRQPQPYALAPADEPVGDDGIFIQAASFADPANAERAKVRLAQIGSVQVDPVSVRSRQFYRVRVGPFADEGAARAALGQTRAEGFRGARVQAE